MRIEEIYFEALARSQGYNTDKDANGCYVDHDTILIRRGFANGFLGGLREATNSIRELIKETEV